MTIRKLHVAAEVNLLPKGLGSRTKLQWVRENLCANVASQMGCFVTVLDRFFTVLTITPSFLVRFWPVKCRIEALITFFRMVKERSVRFSFRSGQWSGQTLVKLGQPWSNLVKLGQNSPNLGKCILGRVSRTFGHSGP